MNKNKNKTIDWDDPNVLRTLSDGWYNVPEGSGYAKELMREPWLREGDTRDLAEKRHQDEQDRKYQAERSHERNICDHTHVVRSKGFRTCMICGLHARDPTQNVPEEGYECRIMIRKVAEDIHNKVRDNFEDLILLLSHPKITVGESLEKLIEVYESYLLPEAAVVGKKKYPFRVSTGPEGLCAALLWREVLLCKIPLTMAGYARKIAVRRETIMHAFKQLDDYSVLHVSKPGRPRKNKNN